MARIGLVLGAGFAKGAYQYGALQALLEFVTVEQLETVSASSIGTLNAIGLCSGNMDRLGSLWTEAGKSHGGFIGWLMRSKYFSESLDTLAFDATSLKTRLVVTLTNLSDMSVEYVNLRKIPPEKMRDYVHACVSMPGFNKAVTLNGKKHIDGGWVDNIPVMPLRYRNLDYTIIIHFDDDAYMFEDSDFDNRVVSVTFPDKTMFTNALFVKGESIERMINEGYEVGKKVFSELFANGTDDIPYILGCISKQHSSRPKRQLRLTTDVVVTNINKVTKKITARKERWTNDE